jgi:hypothetical protein
MHMRKRSFSSAGSLSCEIIGTKVLGKKFITCSTTVTERLTTLPLPAGGFGATGGGARFLTAAGAISPRHCIARKSLHHPYKNVNSFKIHCMPLVTCLSVRCVSLSEVEGTKLPSTWAPLRNERIKTCEPVNWYGSNVYNRRMSMRRMPEHKLTDEAEEPAPDEPPSEPSFVD